VFISFRGYIVAIGIVFVSLGMTATSDERDVMKALLRVPYLLKRIYSDELVIQIMADNLYESRNMSKAHLISIVCLLS
jgi:hypothetical protein